MSRSSVLVGEKTRPVMAARAWRIAEAQAPPSPKARREIAVSYLLKHPCKVCNGKGCVGDCRF